MRISRLFVISFVAVAVLSVSGCGMIQGLFGGMSGPAITVGTPQQGTLEASDRADIFEDGSYTDIYQLDLTAGQAVTITMEAPTFDTYLAVLRGRNDSLATNDDGIPGTTNSRIDFTPPSAGTYYVAATSLASGITGAYTVTVAAPGAAPVPTAPVVPTPVAPTPTPTAGTGNSCDAYQVCCTALASQPGMEAMSASCATIQMLRTAPGGCDATWQAMRASMSANPSAPASCR
jgi:hypothetical protein